MCNTILYSLLVLLHNDYHNAEVLKAANPCCNFCSRNGACELSGRSHPAQKAGNGGLPYWSWMPWVSRVVGVQGLLESFMALRVPKGQKFFRGSESLKVSRFQGLKGFRA